jgi:hypothetical protein
MRFLYMGWIVALIVVFLILFVIAQSASYYRRSWSIADSEVGGQDSVAVSAAVGIGSGVLVLLLLLLLYLGLTRFDWLGNLSPGASRLASPVPIVSPANPANGLPGSTPSASPSAKATP